MCLQIKVFFIMLLLGGLVGCFYDAYQLLHRWMRLKLRFPRGLLDFSDFLFWLLVSGIVFCALQGSNRGELRGYVLLGLATGAWVYRQVQSKLGGKVFSLRLIKGGF